MLGSEFGDDQLAAAMERELTERLEESQRTGVPLRVYAGYGTSKLVGSIPITFKDLHINGGRQTEGSLEVTVSGVYPKIQLDSFTYKTPDQGSSLALLAMGVGGILALRRSRAAQGRS